MATEKIILRIDLDQKEAAKRTAQIEGRLTELKDSQSQLNKEFKEGKITQDQLADSTSQLKREQGALRKENRVLNDVLNTTEGTMGRMKAETKALNREIENFQIGITGTSEDLTKLKGKLKENTNAIREFQTETGTGLTGTFTSLFDKIGLPGGGGGGIGGLIGGLGVGAAAGGGALVAAFGLVSFQQELEKSRRQVALLTGETGAGLDRITAKVKSTADTFDKDFNEVLIAGNAFSKNLGISQEEAFDLISKGLAVGADASGEFLDILREYPTFFKEAGIAADEAIAIISQQVTSGVYSDKGIDTIKEATLTLREMTEPTREALEAIGISSNALEQALREGSISYFDAIQQVSERMGDLEAQSPEVGTALADIFKGAGEDAGLAYILTLADIDTSLDGIIEKGGEFVSLQLRQQKASERLQLVFNQTFGGADGLLKNLKVSALEFAADGLEAIVKAGVNVINFVRNLHNESLAFRVVLEGIQVAFGVLIDTVKFFAQFAVDSLQAVGRTASAVVEAITTLSFEPLKRAAQENLEDISQNFVSFGASVIERFQEGIKDAVDPEFLDPFTLSDGTIEQQYEEGGSKAAAAFMTGVENELANRELLAKAKLAVIGTLEGTEERLEALIAQAQVERDIALQEDGLTHSERLLIQAEFQEESLNLRNEFILAELTQELERHQALDDQFNEFRQQQLANEEAVTDATQQLEDQKIAAKRGTLKAFGVIANAAGKESKAALVVNKASSFADIILNLQQQLAAHATAAAKISATAPPVTIAAGTAYLAAQSSKSFALSAVLKAATSAIKLFAKGGMLGGPSHEEGGIHLGGNQFAEGGEVIINKRSSEAFMPVLDAINSYQGWGDSLQPGRSMFRDGGITAGVASSGISSTGNDLLEAMREIRPVVSVEEIVEGVSNLVEVQTGGDV